MWKSQGERSGLHGGCWSVSQPNFWSLFLTILAVWGRALSWNVRQHFRAFWLYVWRVAAPSATKKRTTPLCSSLLASISNAEQTHFCYPLVCKFRSSVTIFRRYVACLADYTMVPNNVEPWGNIGIISWSDSISFDVYHIWPKHVREYKNII